MKEVAQKEKKKKKQETRETWPPHFIQQLRQSRGYNVDRPGSRYLGCPFWPLPPSRWNSSKYLMNKVKFALDEINTQAQKYGERYELKDLVKVVQANPQRCNLYTFNVMEIVPTTDDVKTVQAMVFTHTYKSSELIEWRFRPGPPSTHPCETSFDSSSDDSPNGCGNSTISSDSDYHSKFLDFLD